MPAQNTNNSTSKSPQKKIQIFNITVLVFGIVGMLIALALIFCLSVTKESIDANGGFEAVSNILNNVDTTSDSSNSQSNQFITSGSQQSTSNSSDSITSTFNLAFVVLNMFGWISFVLNVLTIVFSSIILCNFRDKDKNKKCVNLSISNLIFSIVAANFLNIVFTIFALVFMIREKNLK